MICYKDKTFCSSSTMEHTCGREITQEEVLQALEMQLPVAYSDFCEEHCDKCGADLPPKHGMPPGSGYGNYVLGRKEDLPPNQE